ncbi:small ribosomal subunit protein mS37 [Neocloeon triangulifer]|uniref:small ribosomal subunit protein mS37 n=1 Tax=Neocloeon triangulifer TaxID=2078957 RepID=UPI00286FA64F|nr:small ribosomal subunit protein mS37 [Neocloeon triangulifer]
MRPLPSFAQGYGRRVKARTPAMEPIPFKELLPLKLRDYVSNKRGAAAGASCLQEMANLFTCLKTNEFNQTVCSKEIGTFQQCYKMHLQQREEMKKDTSGIGSKNLSAKQINALLAKYK